MIQSALWVLLVVSALLTARAALSSSWLILWVAALVSLIASLVAIWSIGSLTFLLTCLQLAAAVALRTSASLGGWLAILIAGISTFGVVVYGLAFARAWDIWPAAFPLVFFIWSLPLALDVPSRLRTQ